VHITLPSHQDTVNGDLEMVRADHGISGSLGDLAAVVRDMLIRSIFPQLRVGVGWTAAVDQVLRNQTTSCVHNFFH